MDHGLDLMKTVDRTLQENAHKKYTQGEREGEYIMLSKERSSSHTAGDNFNLHKRLPGLHSSRHILLRPFTVLFLSGFIFKSKLTSGTINEQTME